MPQPFRAFLLGFLLCVSAAFLTASAQFRSQPRGEAGASSVASAAGLPGADAQFGRRRDEQPGLPSPDEPPSKIERRQQVAMNKERQQQLKRDADRLLQLATELKLHVDKSNEGVLSLDVIRKAEEIEKLARSVRTKMKGQ